MNNEEIKKYFMRLSQMKYGWHDKKGKFHAHLKEGNFFKDFYFQTNEEIQKTSSAICWEICELEREDLLQEISLTKPSMQEYFFIINSIAIPS